MQRNRRPNIVVVTTDQQRTDSLSCYGSTFVATPHLDRLAAQGVLCTRAYCTNPVCTPSRASLFSGYQVGRHGAWNVGTSIPAQLPLLSHRVAELGYRTHTVGKMHFQPFGDRRSAESRDRWNDGEQLTTGPYYGFETVELAPGHTTYGMTGAYGEWVLDKIGGDRQQLATFNRGRPRSEPDFGGRAVDVEVPTALQNSTWTAERACAFIENCATTDPDRPFLLAVGFQDPHHPHAVPLDAPCRVSPEAVPLPDYVEGELDDKPPTFAAARHGTINTSEFRHEYPVAGVAGNYDKAAAEAAQLGRAYYYTLVQMIDAQMGRIMDCLDRLGLADNTIVVFTSDHGELLGDHGLWCKGPFHYEQLIRVPLIVRGPGFGSRATAATAATAASQPARPHQAPADGSRCDALISLCDIVPTLMAAIGLAEQPGAGEQTAAGDYDGVDLGPALRGECAAARDHVLVECIDDPAGLRLKTIVTADEKVTFYHDQPFGEAYDLRADPHERRNLWDDPAGRAMRLRLGPMLLSDLERYERRMPRWCYA